MSLNLPPNHKRYIVRLKDGVNVEGHIDGLRRIQNFPQFTRTHTYSPNFINAYVATFDAGHLPTFANHETVHFVEEDTMKTVCTVTTKDTTCWGLARINQPAAVSGAKYKYKYDTDYETGKEVDIYILDTGIYAEHEDFGVRVHSGFVFENGVTGDKNGHGTNVAGIAAGATYGIAKVANLYEVKVLDDTGSGWNTEILKGMDWVYNHATRAENKDRGHVANMSYTGPYSQTENDKVKTLTDAGIHVVVAAGNDSKDAEGYSPASAPTALTVGASDKQDAMWKSSNYGELVNVLAPGVEILSCGKDTSTGISTMTGTSQAAPHVTGIIATFISLDGNLTPAKMIEAIENLSIKNALTGLKPDTANRLVRGCIHADTTLTVKNTKTGSLEVQTKHAIICEDENMSTKESKLVTISQKMVTCTFETSTSTTSNSVSNLAIVSAVNNIYVTIDHGDGATGSAVATIGGTTYTNATASALSFNVNPVPDSAK